MSNPWDGPSASKKQKKKERGGILGALSRLPGDFARDIEDIATGLPTGLYQTGKALTLDARDLLSLTNAMRGQQPVRRTTRIGKNVGRAYAEDFRHPLRHPGNTLFDILGAASLVGGGIGLGARGAASVGIGGARAERLARAMKAPTREIRIPNDPKIKYQGPERTTVTRGRGGKKKYVTKRRDIPRHTPLRVAANPNPLVRGARKVTLDPLYALSLRQANLGKRGGGYSKWQAKRALEQRERRAGVAMASVAQQPHGIRKTAKAVVSKRQKPTKDVNYLQRAASIPANALRTTVYLRPRYLAQNIPQAAFFSATQGTGLGSWRAASRLKKTNPYGYRRLAAMAGEGQAKALNIEGIGDRTRLIGDLVNRPEAAIRVRTLIREAKREGYKSPEELIKDFNRNPYGNRVQRVMERTEEASVAYGRLGKNEKAFMRSQIPIFYPMYKGFARYGARYPTQHSVQASLYGQIGAEGKERQLEDFGGMPPPWWAPFMVKVGERGKQLQVLNPENTVIQSPFFDIFKAGQSMVSRRPVGGDNFLQFVGPLGNLIYGSQSGRELTTGYEARREDLERRGGRLRWAIEQELPGLIPGGEFVSPNTPLIGRRPSRTFEEPSLLQSLGLWSFGRSYMPTWTQPGELQKQIKQEDAIRKRPFKKPKKEKKSGGGANPWDG